MPTRRLARVQLKPYGVRAVGALLCVVLRSAHVGFPCRAVHFAAACCCLASHQCCVVRPQTIEAGFQKRIRSEAARCDRTGPYLSWTMQKATDAFDNCIQKRETRRLSREDDAVHTCGKPSSERQDMIRKGGKWRDPGGWRGRQPMHPARGRGVRSQALPRCPFALHSLNRVHQPLLPWRHCIALPVRHLRSEVIGPEVVVRRHVPATRRGAQSRSHWDARRDEIWRFGAIGPEMGKPGGRGHRWAAMRAWRRAHRQPVRPALGSPSPNTRLPPGPRVSRFLNARPTLSAQRNKTNAPMHYASGCT
jgi:hypothetical protein